MKNVLFLSVVMCQGYGVSVLVEQMAKRLRDRGVQVLIGCERLDNSFPDLSVERVEPLAERVQELATRISPAVIIAVTSPYFELLPRLAETWECWAWEAGDPSPFLIPGEKLQRQEVVRLKQREVYPAARRVVAISEFIKADIGWPDASVIYCGADHVPDMPPKTLQQLSSQIPVPLKVGTLMRLGQGESQYKGGRDFLALARRIKSNYPNTEVHVAGKGSPDDAENYVRLGIIPHLNLSDAEKYLYLRNLDIFVSMSKWEGFNLPVAEAEALGTLSLCYDIGAHPEVCPFVLRDLSEFDSLVAQANMDKDWLYEKSKLSYSYIRSHFSWDRSVDKMISML